VVLDAIANIRSICIEATIIHPREIIVIELRPAPRIDTTRIDALGYGNRSAVLP
jgi:hypothetical protein